MKCKLNLLATIWHGSSSYLYRESILWKFVLTGILNAFCLQKWVIRERNNADIRCLILWFISIDIFYHYNELIVLWKYLILFSKSIFNLPDRSARSPSPHPVFLNKEDPRLMVRVPIDERHLSTWKMKNITLSTIRTWILCHNWPKMWISIFCML